MATPGPEHGRTHRGTAGRLVDGFLRRLLAGAVVYRRAVGFFSSSVFSAADPEFSEFFARGGVMELVCSPVLSAEDARAITAGLSAGREWTGRPLTEVLRLPPPERRTGLLSWAVANRRLEVKIATVVGGAPTALYHEKIGLVADAAGTVTAFDGSANESANAYAENFERVRVFESGAAAAALADEFERLWADRTPGLAVVPFHEALRRGLVRIRRDDSVAELGEWGATPPPAAPAEILRRPTRLDLRPYQREAIDRWFAARGRGIYSMATGTGKTVTALATVEEVFRRCGPPLVLVVVAPYLHLVRQWTEVARTFGLDPINCCGPRAAWAGDADAALHLVEAGRRPLLSLATTNATFAGDPFQALLGRIRVRTVVVADEVHNLGARDLRTKLPDRVALRLGLSATPQRWLDEDGTRAVTDYFGGVVFDLDLEHAMRLNPPVLTPYTYHPILVELEDDEREEYLRLTRALARYMVSPRSEDLGDAALALLLKRARLVASARNKLPALAAAMAPYRDTHYNLVYCGDGRVEADDGSPDVAGARQVEAAAALLGGRLGMNVGVYTADTPDPDRRTLLRDFEDGRTQALVAIRCLDEGVDIPRVRRAFILASSTNPRQFVQRRGRVLRRAEGKESAEVFDFIVVPPLDALAAGTPEHRVLRNLVAKEMARVVEFARLAANGPQARAKLLPVLSALDLLHL